jgi:hypothetical protein
VAGGADRLEDLQDVGDVARRETQLEPGGVGDRVAPAHRVHRRGGVDRQPRLDADVKGVVDLGRAWRIRDAGEAGDSLDGAPAAEAKPPLGACARASRYSHARWIRESDPSAPSWSRMISDQTVLRYLGT